MTTPRCTAPVAGHTGDSPSAIDKCPVHGSKAASGARQLSSAPPPMQEGFVVEVEGFWVDPEAIPPGMRKPRRVEYSAATQVVVPQVTSQEAPVSCVVDRPIDGEQELRYFDGAWYARYLPFSRQSEPSLAGSSHFPARRELDRWQCTEFRSHEEFVKSARAWANSFLVVDDEVWSRTSEPVYTIRTFGLGGNHGGTSVLVSNAGDPDARRPGLAFSATEFELARAAGIQVALERGDTESAARLRRQEPDIDFEEPSLFVFDRPLSWRERATKSELTLDDEEVAANSPDAGDREALAANPAASGGTLVNLSRDSDPAVRAASITNPSAPRELVTLAAKYDSDENVRAAAQRRASEAGYSLDAVGS